MDKIDFLMQSAILKLDEEIIVWLLKFGEKIGKYLNSNLTVVHKIFEKDEEIYVLGKTDPN